VKDFKPTADRIVVQRDDPETQSKGGIYLPPTAPENTQTGIVLSVGPGARDSTGARTPMEVEPGDHILFGKYSGVHVKLSGEEILMIRADDVLAVLDG